LDPFEVCLACPPFGFVDGCVVLEHVRAPWRRQTSDFVAGCVVWGYLSAFRTSLSLEFVDSCMVLGYFPAPGKPWGRLRGPWGTLGVRRGVIGGFNLGLVDRRMVLEHFPAPRATPNLGLVYRCSVWGHFPGVRLGALGASSARHVLSTGAWFWRNFRPLGPFAEGYVFAARGRSNDTKQYASLIFTCFDMLFEIIDWASPTPPIPTTGVRMLVRPRVPR